MKTFSLTWTTVALALSASGFGSVAAAPTAKPDVSYKVSSSPSKKSNFGLGAFIETNINSGTDGGLYAELIRNRAFQDTVPGSDQNDVLGQGTLASWSAVGSNSKLSLSLKNQLTGALPQSAVVSASSASSKSACGIANSGFAGVPVQQQPYALTFYARSPSGKTETTNVKVGLYSSDYSKSFVEKNVSLALTSEWKQFSATLTPSTSTGSNDNVFAIQTAEACGDGLQLNLVSLLPPTWKGTVARPDLAQALADIKPVYVRLPGGNDLEGNTIPAAFNWTNAVGDLKNRPGRTPTWTQSWNTEGLGLMELMDLTEKWGAQAILGVYAGYSLNGKAVAASDLGPYIQSALDQLHFLTDTSGKWASLRASYGRAQPYQLQHIEIGNEDWLGAAVNTYGPYRWKAFADAISKEFPKLNLIASTLLNGVQGAKDVDNHMYDTPDGMIAFADSMDSTSRDVNVWELEYAVINSGLTHDTDLYGGPGRLQHPTLIGALAESAFLCGAERNGDVYYSAAYAPIFMNEGPNLTQWTPDMLSFTPNQMVKSTSYYSQYAFGNNAIASIHSSSPSASTSSTKIYHSFGSTTDGSKMIIKMVNTNAAAKTASVRLDNQSRKFSTSGATIWQMKGSDAQAANTVSNPNAVTPSTGALPSSALQKDHSLSLDLPAYSLTVITIPYN